MIGNESLPNVTVDMGRPRLAKQAIFARATDAMRITPACRGARSRSPATRSSTRSRTARLSPRRGVGDQRWRGRQVAIVCRSSTAEITRASRCMHYTTGKLLVQRRSPAAPGRLDKPLPRAKVTVAGGRRDDRTRRRDHVGARRRDDDRPERHRRSRRDREQGALRRARQHHARDRAERRRDLGSLRQHGGGRPAGHLRRGRDGQAVHQGPHRSRAPADRHADQGERQHPEGVQRFSTARRSNVSRPPCLPDNRPPRGRIYHEFGHALHAAEVIPASAARRCDGEVVADSSPRASPATPAWAAASSTPRAAAAARSAERRISLAPTSARSTARPHHRRRVLGSAKGVDRAARRGAGVVVTNKLFTRRSGARSTSRARSSRRSRPTTTTATSKTARRTSAPSSPRSAAMACASRAAPSTPRACSPARQPPRRFGSASPACRLAARRMRSARCS